MKEGQITPFSCGCLSGIITGILLTCSFGLFLAKESNPDLIIFPEAGKCITSKNLIVFQVLESDTALVRTENISDNMILLLKNDDGTVYYDNMNVKVPDKKCAKQVGIFRYKTRDQFEKTVPVVKILPKK